LLLTKKKSQIQKLVGNTPKIFIFENTPKIFIFSFKLATILKFRWKKPKFFQGLKIQNFSKAMVFLGKKLQREKTLAEVEHLADGHTVQLVRQREEPKKVLNESQANATIAECKKMVKQVRTNQDYSRHIRVF
jgi:hypothetical protein